MTPNRAEQQRPGSLQSFGKKDVLLIPDPKCVNVERQLLLLQMQGPPLHVVTIKGDQFVWSRIDPCSILPQIPRLHKDALMTDHKVKLADTT